jgi:hypothetical protein
MTEHQSISRIMDLALASWIYFLDLLHLLLLTAPQETGIPIDNDMADERDEAMRKLEEVARQRDGNIKISLLRQRRHSCPTVVLYYPGVPFSRNVSFPCF